MSRKDAFVAALLAMPASDLKSCFLVLRKGEAGNQEEERFSYQELLYELYPHSKHILEPASSKPTHNPKDAHGAAKPQLWLNPPSALRAMARAMENGAEKYGPYNWRENEVRAEVYISAALRHIAAYQDGERADPDSGAHPLAHAMASLAILIDGEDNGNATSGS